MKQSKQSKRRVIELIGSSDSDIKAIRFNRKTESLTDSETVEQTNIVLDMLDNCIPYVVYHGVRAEIMSEVMAENARLSRKISMAKNALEGKT